MVRKYSFELNNTTDLSESVLVDFVKYEDYAALEKLYKLTELSKFEQERDELWQRAESAEAKLAELARQEPVAYAEAADLRTLLKDNYAYMFAPCDLNKTNQSTPLYARPAPAINLAELVPDIEPYCPGLWPYGVKALQDYRDAILRNIEEAKWK